MPLSIAQASDRDLSQEWIHFCTVTVEGTWNREEKTLTIAPEGVRHGRVGPSRSTFESLAICPDSRVGCVESVCVGSGFAFLQHK